MADFGPFEGSQDVRNFERTLRQMGINPLNAGIPKTTTTLPPLPGSDPVSLEKNTFSNFYKYRAQEYWQEAEINAYPVEEFKKCKHNLMKKNNEAYCTICHIGWVINDSFEIVDGKLLINDRLLAFNA